MSDIVPPAIELLPDEIRSRLVVSQQARRRISSGSAPITRGSASRLEVEPFFKDLPRRMAEAHLVISRSGASTVAELAAIGRPSILVPLPGALDQDQAANAATLEAISAPPSSCHRPSSPRAPGVRDPPACFEDPAA